MQLSVDAVADEVSVAEAIVNAAYGNPEFVCFDPRERECCFLAAVFVVPLVGNDHIVGVRGVDKYVVFSVDNAGMNLFNLLADNEQHVHESVEFGK